MVLLARKPKHLGLDRKNLTELPLEARHSILQGGTCHMSYLNAGGLDVSAYSLDLFGTLPKVIVLVFSRGGPLQTFLPRIHAFEITYAKRFLFYAAHGGTECPVHISDFRQSELEEGDDVLSGTNNQVVSQR